MIILSIDPGTNYTGVTFWDIDDHDFSIKHIDSFTIDLTVINYTNESYKIIQRINLLIRTLERYIDYYKPYYLVIEAGFINILRPAAYGPIANTIYAIENLFISKTYTYNIIEYPPKYVKQYISKGTADKNDIRLAVSKISDITTKINIDMLSEHAVDSLAIGYTFINILQQYPEILFKG